METKRNEVLEALRARAKEAREKAIAEGRAIPSIEHRNAFIERMKARAAASEKTMSPMAQERMLKIIERFKNRTKIESHE